VEISARRAREAADHFMGPTLGILEWQESRLRLFQDVPRFRDHTAILCGPAWVIVYEPYYGLGDQTSLFVDLWGNVLAANSKKLDDWISLSEIERFEEQEAMVKACYSTKK